MRRCKSAIWASIVSICSTYGLMASLNALVNGSGVGSTLVELSTPTPTPPPPCIIVASLEPGCRCGVLLPCESCIGIERR